VGDSARGSGLSTEMSGVRTSDYDCQENRGKKYKRNTQKDLKIKGRNGIVSYCDILFILVPGTKDREPKDHKEVQAT